MYEVTAVLPHGINKVNPNRGKGNLKMSQSHLEPAMEIKDPVKWNLKTVQEKLEYSHGIQSFESKTAHCNLGSSKGNLESRNRNSAIT